MQLVADYTWEVVIVFENDDNQNFKFTANGNWNDNWGDSNQTDRRPDFNGTADYFGSNIRIRRNNEGPATIQFNEQTLQYSLIAD